MRAQNNISNRIPSPGKNPFKVPDGYFDNLHNRVMKGIENQPGTRRVPVIRFVRSHPYYSIAASVAGLVLITYLLLQTVIGPGVSDDTQYDDLALLEDYGVLSDETIFADSYSDTQDDNYTEWEEGAITFLASNEVDIFQLIESY